ncbi:MAG: hypothetical protein MI810_17585 [Flavobacteriales bacterium]|nr:hypothetical protein [Flavobacteriales bacterium]
MLRLKYFLQIFIPPLVTYFLIVIVSIIGHVDFNMILMFFPLSLLVFIVSWGPGLYLLINYLYNGPRGLKLDVGKRVILFNSTAPLTEIKIDKLILCQRTPKNETPNPYLIWSNFFYIEAQTKKGIFFFSCLDVKKDGIQFDKVLVKKFPLIQNSKTAKDTI